MKPGKNNWRRYRTNLSDIGLKPHADRCTALRADNPSPGKGFHEESSGFSRTGPSGNIRSTLHKRPIPQIRQRLLDLLDRVHHERPVGHDRLVERRAGHQHEAHARLRRRPATCTASPSPKTTRRPPRPARPARTRPALEDIRHGGVLRLGWAR